MGVLDSYRDIHGTERITTRDTRAALLRAMGLAIEHDADAERELARLDDAAAQRLLEPVAVVRAHAWQLPALPVAEGTEWSAELVLEDGTRTSMRGVTSAAAPPATPAPLPLGYHELRVSADDGGRTREASQLLIVSPAQCTTVERRLGGRRAVGVLANLYSLRSAHDWGCGDVGDLRRLADWVARAGGSFVGINPLHALCNRGAGVSPYFPVSRLFNNPIYLDVTALPELADAPDAASLVADTDFAAARDALRARRLVDYEEVMRLKRRVLRLLHRAFVRVHRDRDTPRGNAYRRYRLAQGETLDRFAVFCAIAEHLAGPNDDDAPECDWRRWPAPLRDPGSAAVADFARGNEDAVDFHRYLQFALDAQLAGAADALALGVYRDLAVGSAPDGCDTWAWPSLFAQGATIGAPPDDFAADGQNWGLPPIMPRALRDDRYRYWIRLLRSSFAHGGALRIDHVMGLFRQYWVPTAMPAQRGAYVRYPAEELLHITALESHRHNAIVVGENLGTVPPEVGPALDAHGMLSSAVMYFERNAGGDFLPSADYPAHALVSVGTHDHVPLAGFLNGRDLEIHRELGLLADDDARRRALTERERARQALLERLEHEGVAPASTAGSANVVAAAHAFLGRTPAVMVGVALDDLGLETDPVNVPGTTDSHYPNWQRKMRRTLEEIATPGAAAALRAGGGTVEPGTPPSV